MGAGAVRGAILPEPPNAVAFRFQQAQRWRAFFETSRTKQEAQKAALLRASADHAKKLKSPLLAKVSRVVPRIVAVGFVQSSGVSVVLSEHNRSPFKLVFCVDGRVHDEFVTSSLSDLAAMAKRFCKFAGSSGRVLGAGGDAFQGCSFPFYRNVAASENEKILQIAWNPKVPVRRFGKLMKPHFAKTADPDPMRAVTDMIGGTQPVAVRVENDRIRIGRFSGSHPFWSLLVNHARPLGIVIEFGEFIVPTCAVRELVFEYFVSVVMVEFRRRAEELAPPNHPRRAIGLPTPHTADSGNVMLAPYETSDYAFAVRARLSKDHWRQLLNFTLWFLKHTDTKELRAIRCSSSFRHGAVTHAPRCQHFDACAPADDDTPPARHIAGKPTPCITHLDDREAKLGVRKNLAKELIIAVDCRAT